MKLLVTGSSGQIGSYVVDCARRSGHTTVGLDLRKSSWTDVVADVRDRAAVCSAAAGCDAVVHLAAQVSVQGSIDDPSHDASHNILGTLSTLEGARAAGVSRFIFTSSAAVYGPPKHLPIAESHPTNPLSPYGVSKLAGEHYARVLAALHGFHLVVVRPFNVFSPRQNPGNPYSGVISKFVARARTGVPPIIYGDGTHTRDFVHAEDVASWMVRLATNVTPDVRTVNLGTGIATSVRQLADLVLEIANVDAPPRQESPRVGDIPRSVADVRQAQSIGLIPSRSLKEGIRDMLESGVDRPMSSRHAPADGTAE